MLRLPPELSRGVTIIDDNPRGAAMLRFRLSAYGVNRQVCDGLIELLSADRAVLATSNATGGLMVWCEGGDCQTYFAIEPGGLRCIYKLR